MERLGSFLGIVGAVMLGFGLLGGLATSSFSVPLIFIHLVLGVLLLCSWFAFTGIKHLGETGEVLTGRASRFGLNVTLYVTVFIALLVTANWYVNKHDRRWDLTAEGVYSLAPQSRQTIDNLKKPLKLVGFKLSEQGELLADLLELYQSQAPSLVTVELIDPRAKPHLVDSYGMKPGNLVYIEYGTGDSKGVSRVNDATEEAVTNAIIKLTRGDAKKVYIVQGHDEPSVEDTTEFGLKDLVAALEDEHLKPEPLILSQFESVPSDAGAVLLVAPKKPLLPQEKESLTKFAEGGGRLLLLNEPRSSRDVTDIAGYFGIAVRSDIIVDQVQRLFGPTMLGVQPMITNYASHPMTKGMGKQSVTIFDGASSVAAISGTKSKDFVEVLKTGPNAWGESNLELLFSEEQASLDEADTQGPLAIAVVYEKNLDDSGNEAAKEDVGTQSFKKSARVVVFGDADWIQNRLLRYYSNRDLALNVVNWLVGEEGGVTIRPKSMKASLASIDRATFMQILGMSFLLPELFLIFGLYVWWGRRREGVS